MDVEKCQLLLTIDFDPPFYKAIFESVSAESYEVAQVNLGTSEPKLTLILDLVLNHWDRVHFFKQKQFKKNELPNKINPKRKQRLAPRAVKNGFSTKSQVALKKQFEQNKLANKRDRKLKKEQLIEKKFKLKQEKRIEKHKGH